MARARRAGRGARAWALSARSLENARTKEAMAKSQADVLADWHDWLTCLEEKARRYEALLALALEVRAQLNLGHMESVLQYLARQQEMGREIDRQDQLEESAVARLLGGSAGEGLAARWERLALLAEQWGRDGEIYGLWQQGLKIRARIQSVMRQLEPVYAQCQARLREQAEQLQKELQRVQQGRAAGRAYLRSSGRPSAIIDGRG